MTLLNDGGNDMRGQIAIIGGDERTIALMKRLVELKRRKIFAVGFNNVENLPDEIQTVAIEEIPVQTIDYIILPVQGMNDEKQVYAKLENKWIQLQDGFFNQLNKTTKILTGIATKALNEIKRDFSLEVIPILTRDDLAIRNSIPTAEGALLIALQNTTYTIHNSKVLITGYGRIGQTIARVFDALRAKVYIYTKEKSDAARAESNGLQSLSNEEFKWQISSMNIVLNTVPDLIIDDDLLKRMNKQTLIIELSSYPGGVDVDNAINRGFEAIVAGGLPGKVAPVTAGTALAEVISEYI